MTHNNRIVSVDIAKGFILLIIIALTDYYPGILRIWFNSEPLPSSLNIISGLSFTAFFYLSGITFPFFVSKKINQNNSTNEIIRMIFARTLILITVGMLLENISRVDASLTGLSQPLWTFFLITAIFLTWNRYPDRDNNFFTVNGLRVAGLAILVFLVLKFNSGTYENNGSLIPGCWELPGLLGWGFLVSSLTWLALHNSLTGTFTVWLFFFSLNVISALGLNDYLDPARKYFGVLIDGFIPSIVLAGHLTGILLKKYPVSELLKPALIIGGAGVLFIISGILSVRFFPLSDSFNNPSLTLAGTGTASLLFILLYIFTELRKPGLRAGFAGTAGAGFFSAYLIYFFISSAIALTGINLLFYKTSGIFLIKAGGSVAFALIIILSGNLLARTGIRLKF